MMGVCHQCGALCDLADMHMWRGVQITLRRRRRDRLLCAECHQMRRSARAVAGQMRLGAHI